EPNGRTAASWFRRAAEHGDPGGQFDLASLYSLGRGVPLDYVSAYYWFTRAAAQGDERSARCLKQLSKVMTPRQIREARARVEERLGQPSGQSDIDR
ncbi:MAG: sel1 repeat family protein, partial [Acidobacteria bacterium]|nr:sel1 repeat family protein [Acidobacteriota bacterium]